MSRASIALVGGIAGFVLYVMVVVAVADHVVRAHWLVQLAYFTIAGIAWVWPAKRLMFWAARAGR